MNRRASFLPLPGGQALTAAILVGAGVVALTASGCDSETAPDLRLLTAVWWNRDPRSADEIGYQVMVDFGWLDRAETCFPLSAELALEVNERKFAPTSEGRCQWDILVAAKGFDHDQTLNIRLHDGDRELGNATYTGMFPGASAQLLSPTGGIVHAGETIVIGVPAGVAPIPDSYGANFYWHDSPAGVPPFHTFAPAHPGAESGTIQTTAPTLTGPAALAIQTVYPQDLVAPTSCSGFISCIGEPNNDTLGAIEIEVVP